MTSLFENEAQELAVSTTEGPVIVISCPGSGKTTTLVRRIHTMLERGVAPTTILMVTFAKSAAEDMAARYRAMYGTNPGITFATIHSLCYNILAKEAGLVSGMVVKERDKMDFFYHTLRPMQWVNDAWDLAISMITELSAVRGSDRDISTYNSRCCKAEYFRQMARAYEDYKDMRGKIDFDDMLTRCRDLLATRPEVLSKWQDRFHYIQCDEYQDTNAVQRDILYMLADRTKNFCVVGDDDQSIYAFRGADSSIMLKFKNDFPDAKVIHMSTNYRSTQRIVDTADSCIRNNKVRFRKDFICERGKSGETGYVEMKTFETLADESKHVLENIQKLHEGGMPYEDMAILFRNNRQAASPVQVLTNAGIPFYAVESIKTLYDGWIFEDIRSYIALSMGEHIKDNLLRVLNRPNRYLKYDAFQNAVYTTQGMLSCLSYLGSDEWWKEKSAKEKIYSLMNNFGPGKISETTSADLLFANLIGPRGIGYDDYILQSARYRNQDPGELMEELDTLRKDAQKCGTVGQWLDYARQMQISAKNASTKKDRSGVRISTIHRAKGQEWKAVFLIGVSESVIPGKNSVRGKAYEEERRVLYVGMTRAKDRLYISCSGDESPFLTETKAALRKLYTPKADQLQPGTYVRHRRFGRGVIRHLTPKTIRVEFEKGGEKLLAYPKVFEDGMMELI